MKALCKNRFLRLAPVTAFGLLLAQTVPAQTFTTLYNFTNGTDGANPYGFPTGVVISGNTLYGTATYGGASGNGSVFAVNINGTGFTNLHSFSATNGPDSTNSDGAEPNGLIISGNTLYGTTYLGGTGGSGTVFALSTNGSVFTNLHNFSATDPDTGANTDGAFPLVGVILSSNTLYGTTTFGGTAGNGAIFALSTNGLVFSNLHSFTATNYYTGLNSDGALPFAGLSLYSNTLYGSAVNGGASGYGTLFALTTNGSVFTNVHSFSALDRNSGTNTEGASPNSLIISNNTIYGTANGGGSAGYGSVFAISTNGAVVANLHSFSATNSVTGTNYDGAFPVVGLLLSGNTLYGTASFGGNSGNGTVFAVNTNGAAFTNLHNFSATDPKIGGNSDGADPQAGLILSGDVLYGTTYFGGSSGYGVVFGFSFVPALSITPSGNFVLLTWPTNVDGFSYAGFTLQSTTNLISPSWNTVSPAPVIIGSQYTVINSASGAQQFYRLTQ